MQAGLGAAIVDFVREFAPQAGNGLPGSPYLVPAALRRVLRVPIDDPRVERALADQMAPEDDRQGSGSESIHAKRILGAGGSLSEALGAELRAGEIARAMRTDDLHDDVLALFKRIGTLSGLQASGPEVVILPNRHERRSP